MVEGAKFIPIDKIPRKQMQTKHQNQIFPLFRQLTDENALELELAKFNITLGGIRYLLSLWNKRENDSLKYRVLHSRSDNPIVYVFRRKS